MRRLPVAVVAFALAASSAPASPTGPAVIEKTGPHFRVLCHIDDDAIAAAALETVEAVWPLASSLFGLPDEPVSPRLEVHLYRNVADYLAASRELAGNDFDRNMAFTSFETRSSYVALQPDLKDEALVRVGITSLTRQSLAHEAAHLVEFRATPNFRAVPQWLAEGSAVWIASETLVAKGWAPAREEDPFCAADMVRARQLLACGALPLAKSVLRDDVNWLDLYDRYAVQTLFFRRLVTRRDNAAFRGAVLEAMRLEPCADYAKRVRELVEAVYATEGLDGLDLDYEQFVRSQTPAWDELFRALSTSGRAWTQAAFEDHDAIAWRTEPVGLTSYSVGGEFEILPGTGEADQMNFLLARNSRGDFVSLAFRAGFGVAAFRYDAAEGQWHAIGEAPLKSVQVKRRTSFRVDVDGWTVTVRLDGVKVLTVDVKDHGMSGPWGLGVQPGAAGVWRDVKVEPTDKPRK